MANSLFPFGEQRGADEHTFDDLVSEEVELFTRELLPRYVEAHHYGGGRFMLRQLLLDLDRDSFLEILQQVPSRKLTARARSTAERLVGPCAVLTSDQLRVGTSGDILLGRYSRSGDERPEGLVRRALGRSGGKDQIVLYRGSFEAIYAMNPVSPDQLRHEVLRVIAHEFLHYLEACLLPRAADKRFGGDASFHIARHTLAEARRQDAIQVLFRGLRFAALGMIGVLGLWATLWMATGG